MDPLLIALVTSVAIVAGVLFLLINRRKPTEEPVEPEDERSSRPQANRPTRPGRTRTGLNRMVAARRVQERRGRLRDESPDDMPEYYRDEGDDPSGRLGFLDEAFENMPNKMGTKKMLKELKKEERAREREEEQQRREEKRERDAMREEARRKKERERELEEEKKLEEERIRKEEEEKRLDEEYQQLKGLFTVESEGAEQLNEEESQSLLQEFVSFIKETKVVMLEDLAAHFSLKTQDAIARLQTLLDEGQLEGMMDDRGKFIYLTAEELEAVAKYIRQNGRVAISDLAEASTGLVNLQTAHAVPETSVAA